MLGEDGSMFGPALIFTALPESIQILGALPLFLRAELAISESNLGLMPEVKE